MSEHAAHAVHEVPGHAAPGHSPVDAMRFEKEELAYFVEDDQYCGSAIGKLLAATFCILLVLMTGVTIWTFRYEHLGQDPHEVQTMAVEAHH